MKRPNPNPLPVFSESDVIRFNGMVSPKNDNGCCLWLGGVNSRDYGAFYVSGQQVLSHRASYLIHHGPIEDGKLVLHKCDIPRCVNPEHLFLGTVKDNAIDCTKKGRNAECLKKATEASRITPKPRGSGHSFAKLSEAIVLEIRRKFKTGWGTRQIGAEYGVHPMTIHAVVTGKTWAHVL